MPIGQFISAQGADHANNFWECNWGYYYALTHSVEKPALVFMSPYEAYKLVYFTAPPREADAVIFAHDLGPDRNQGLMDHYPDRHVYRAQWYRITKIR